MPVSPAARPAKARPQGTQNDLLHGRQPGSSRHQPPGPPGWARRSCHRMHGSHPRRTARSKGRQRTWPSQSSERHGSTGAGPRSTKQHGVSRTRRRHLHRQVHRVALEPRTVRLSRFATSGSHPKRAGSIASVRETVTPPPSVNGQSRLPQSSPEPHASRASPCSGSTKPRQ